jgi:hypothetical protein
MKKMVNLLSIVFISVVFSSFAYAQEPQPHMSVGGKGDSGQGQNTGPAAETRITYTIWNTTKYNIEILFLPNKNKTSLAPGVKKACNSPIRNGQFPKVKAYASNGATWLRTISVFNGEYRIVDRITDSGSPGIQIVP